MRAQSAWDKATTESSKLAEELRSMRSSSESLADKAGRLADLEAAMVAERRELEQQAAALQKEATAAQAKRAAEREQDRQEVCACLLFCVCCACSARWRRLNTGGRGGRRARHLTCVLWRSLWGVALLRPATLACVRCGADNRALYSDGISPWDSLSAPLQLGTLYRAQRGARAPTAEPAFNHLGCSVYWCFVIRAFHNVPREHAR